MNVWEVIDAAATKPFGYEPFYPGAGAGGHCIPVDPLFLSWLARENDTRISTIEAAKDINDSMPEVITRRFEQACERHGLTLSESNVVALGLTYKAGVADMRNSPAVEVCSLLAECANSMTAVEPMVLDAELADFEWRHEILPETFDERTGVILLVPNRSFDYERIVDTAQLVFDVMNSLPDTLVDRENVVQFGGGGK